MIPAKKEPTLDKLLYYVLLGMLRKRFFAIDVHGLEHLQNLEKHRPAVGVATHTNWWDGLMIFFLTRLQTAKHFYCMMEEKQLRHYKFFTWIGAFSVDPSNPVRAAAGTLYATRLLRNPANFVWIFPQGKMTSPYEKIEIQPGADFLARQAHNAQILPVAFRYEFFREDRPFVLIRIGKSFPAPECSGARILTELQSLADTLEQDARTGDFTGYVRTLKPRLSANKRWEWCLQAVRGKLKTFEREN